MPGEGSRPAPTFLLGGPDPAPPGLPRGLFLGAEPSPWSWGEKKKNKKKSRPQTVGVRPRRAWFFLKSSISSFFFFPPSRARQLHLVPLPKPPSAGSLEAVGAGRAPPGRPAASCRAAAQAGPQHLGPEGLGALRARGREQKEPPGGQTPGQNQPRPLPLLAPSLEAQRSRCGGGMVGLGGDGGAARPSLSCLLGALGAVSGWFCSIRLSRWGWSRATDAGTGPSGKWGRDPLGSQLRSGTGLAAGVWCSPHPIRAAQPVWDGERLWDQDRHRFGARNGTGMGLGVGLDSGFG